MDDTLRFHRDDPQAGRIGAERVADGARGHHLEISVPGDGVAVPVPGKAMCDAPPVEFGIWEMGLENSSILTSVRESRTIERAEGKWMYASNPWLQDLSSDIPQELIVCPLVLKKHTVAAIIGYSRKRSLDNDEIEFLVRIMKKASVSLEMLILKSRILML